MSRGDIPGEGEGGTSGYSGFWNDRFFLLSFMALAVEAVFVSIYGHLAFNGRIYAYFACLSDQGVNIFNSKSITSWTIDWHYLDFSPFNLLIYKLIYLAPGVVGERLFRAYQCALLIVALCVIRRFRQLGYLDSARYRSLIILTALNVPYYVLNIMTSEDKAFYFALPLIILVFIRKPPLQALIIGIWAGWSGLGILFAPVALVHFTRNKKAILSIILMLSGIVLALAPFFPESRILFANRSAREAQQPFWFSIWRLLGPWFLPVFDQLGILVYAGAVWVLFALKRITFARALVAICLSYCLFSNNTSPSRIFTTLFLVVLFLKPPRLCYVYTAAVVCFELLSGLARSRIAEAVGFLNPTSTSEPKMILNVFLVNGLTLVGMYFVFRRELPDKTALPSDHVHQLFL